MIERKEKLIMNLSKNKLIQKYICEYTWLSGSSIKVFPIMCNFEKDITIQIKTDKNYFNKFINKILTEYNDILDYGYFWKSDGSCPSTIVFKFKESK